MAMGDVMWRMRRYGSLEKLLKSVEGGLSHFETWRISAAHTVLMIAALTDDKGKYDEAIALYSSIIEV